MVTTILSSNPFDFCNPPNTNTSSNIYTYIEQNPSIKHSTLSTPITSMSTRPSMPCRGSSFAQTGKDLQQIDVALQ